MDMCFSYIGLFFPFADTICLFSGVDVDGLSEERCLLAVTNTHQRLQICACKLCSQLPCGSIYGRKRRHIY